MRPRTALLTKRNRKSIFLTFLLLLTLPVFVYSLIQNSSFDTRNKAFEDIQISELNPCIITFPNVNPYTIEVGKTVRVQVDALSKTFDIKSMNITDSTNNILFTKEYTDLTDRVTESFPFTPQFPRAYNILGKIVDTNDQTFECVISSPYDIKGVKAITSNSKPIFTSSPKESIPSQSITTGVTYEYTIEAEDADQDTINYAYSFTIGETWLKPTVIDDGGNGKLTIKLKGSTKKPGSYLANIFIHDGYSTHLSSQSWVISVSPKDNSNPNVKITDPVQSQRITENKPLTLKWDAQDDDKIVRYEIYLSPNPANQDSWISINESVPPTQTTFDIDFTGIQDGTYRAIVRAVDDQTPSGIGMDVSEEIILALTPTQPEVPDDQTLLPEPQIINISPTNSDSINNTLPTIKASLVSADETKIDETSILLKLDNRDITKEVKINKISDNEYTVIYIPEQPLTTGLHKVSLSFRDSNKTSTEKSWTFTIMEDEEEITDTFNLFGFEVAKRTTYIIFGGLALILLAIVVPILIAAIWKDESKDPISTNNYALPKSVPPTTEIPQVQKEANDLQELVKQDFQPPEPITPTPTQPAQPNITAPEPEADLNALYKEIENIKKEDTTSSK